MSFLYRIVTRQEWANIQVQGCILPTENDIEYMHLSTEEYVEETADIYFQQVERLLVLKIDRQLLTDKLLFEPVKNRNDVLFPHYFSDKILLSCVIDAIPLEFIEGIGFQMQYTL